MFVGIFLENSLIFKKLNKHPHPVSAPVKNLEI